MKRVIITIAFLLVAVLPAGAWTVNNNPDSRISVGFAFNRVKTEGDYTYRTFWMRDAGNFVQTTYQGDLRVPVLSWLTINFGGGYVTNELGLSLNGRSERWIMNGYNLNTGLRVYLP